MISKLSAAQQFIVHKMKEGWYIRKVGNKNQYAQLWKDNMGYMKVNLATLNVLKKKGLIIAFEATDTAVIYKLVERS
jgi:hypothetical protein